jgi:hypothetical protein
MKRPGLIANFNRKGVGGILLVPKTADTMNLFGRQFF